MVIVNKIVHDYIESNLVYPNWTNKQEYRVVGVLDKDFVLDYLQRTFNVNRIGNKYAIHIDNNMLWYQHDFKTFMLEQL
jgi:hypothetical protein